MPLRFSSPALAAALALGFCGATAQAQTTEYIVRFTDASMKAAERSSSKPVTDDRYATEPRAWGYLKPAVVGEVQRLEKRHAFSAKQAYSHALSGFSADLTAQQAAALRQESNIDLVEEVKPTRVAALDLLSGLTSGLLGNLLGGGRTTATPAPATPATPTPASTQTVPYGIALTGATRSWSVSGDGSGSVDGPTVYVIDSGIADSTDLNLVSHVNFISGGSNTDCNGHGTHVAGTIGARDNTEGVVGIAPGVKLVGVKALGCDGNGTTAVAIKALDWVTANAMRPAVANLSFTAASSQAFDDALRRSAAAGIVYAVAAGNSGSDACYVSPARVGGITPGVLVTGATDSADAPASFSNVGNCVDIWAPGVEVVSTGLTGGTATRTGTSQAAPHVAGAAALILGRYPQTTADAVWRQLKDGAADTGRTSRSGQAVKRVRADIQ